ncbi:hypothetical protein ACQKI5_21390, partial [Agrobacterium tumefaciens]
RVSAGCSHRATWRIQNRRGSNRHWMKVQWQVSPRTGPVIAKGSDRGSAYEGEIRCHSNEQLTKILM